MRKWAEHYVSDNMAALSYRQRFSQTGELARSCSLFSADNKRRVNDLVVPGTP